MTLQNEFECNFCDRIEKTLSNFKKHVKDHEIEKCFRCPNCGQFFDTVDVFVNHKKSCTSTLFKCQFKCGKEYDDLNRLKIHQVAHKIKKDCNVNSNAKRSFPCSDCGQSFGSEKGLENHKVQKWCQSNSDYSCQVCNKTFSSELCLRRHYQSQHGRQSEEFRCEICDKEFKSRFSLKSHIKIHTGATPFKCDFCDKEFNRKDNLKRHVLTHGDKKFKCQVENCQKEFHRKDKFEEHLDMHNG